MVKVSGDLILTPGSERECLRISDLSSIRLTRTQTEDHTVLGVVLIVAGIAIQGFGFLLIAWGAGCLVTKGYVYHLVVNRYGEEIELYRGGRRSAVNLLESIRAKCQNDLTLF